MPRYFIDLLARSPQRFGTLLALNRGFGADP